MSITLADLARSLGAPVWGDGSLRILGAAEPAQAGGVQDGAARIALAMGADYAAQLSPGAVALISEGMDPAALGLAGAVIVQRPRLAMAGLTRALDAGPQVAPGVHPSAVIDPSAHIGEGGAIGPLVVIGAGVRIGEGARIAAQVTIGDGTTLGAQALIHAGARIAHGVTAGDRLIVQPGAVIGSDGFSFVTPEVSGIEEIRATLGTRGEIRDQHWVRIHSLGGVRLGNDVEIGANATIDRGTIRATAIGDGTKIDNLVHVGHNVVVGRDCLLCGQVGIAGSARIGDRVVLAGQCGVSDNIFVGDDVIAGGATKIFSNVPAGRVILGSPATRMETQVEINKALRRLPRLATQVAALQKNVTRLMQDG